MTTPQLAAGHHDRQYDDLPGPPSNNRWLRLPVCAPAQLRVPGVGERPPELFEALRVDSLGRPREQVVLDFTKLLHHLFRLVLFLGGVVHFSRSWPSVVLVSSG